MNTESGADGMKIAITGATGFVGHKLAEKFPDAVRVPSFRNLTEAEIEAAVKALDADILIHTAAIADMSACERDPEGAYIANIRLPELIAKFFTGKKLICFSSDQVYNASPEPGPYVEGMETAGNVYGKSKIEMEKRVLDIRPDAVMLRAEWMYDYFPGRGNYFRNLLAAEGVIRESRAEYRGVTYVQEVADVMPKVFELPGGAYNFGSETDRSIYDITKDFAAYLGKDIEVVDRESGHNLWMNCGKAAAYGVIFSNASEGLKKCADDWQAAGQI